MGIGQFIGMFIAVTISDNISRRKAYIFCISGSNIGFLMVFLAQNIAMAVVGIFIIGLFTAPALRIIQSIVT